MSWFLDLSPRQSQAADYFSSLSEAVRKQKAKLFYDYVRTTKPQGRISHQSLLNVFERYCNTVLRNRPGPSCMRFRHYCFLLRTVGALEKTRWPQDIDERQYVILPWPRELSPEELLQRYMSAESQPQASSALGVVASSTGTSTVNLTQTIMGLLKEHREALMQDKCEVQIASTGDLHDAKIRFQPVVVHAAFDSTTSKPAAPQTISIEITNVSDRHPKKFLRCGFIQPCPSFVLEDSMAISYGLCSSVEIGPGVNYTVKCTFSPKHMSVYKSTLAFEFKDGATGKKFHIIRFVSGSGQASQRDMELVKQTAPYRPFKPKPRRKGLAIIDGIKPPGPRYRIQRRRDLAEHRIPPEINNEMKNNNPSQVLVKQLQKDLQQNYKEIFDALLWVEEKQMHQDIRRYDRKKELEKTPGGYLVLQVDGLAENRPSILKGDHIFVSWEGHENEYTGYVHRVQLETVWLKFHPSFHSAFIPGKKYDIRFTFNRFPLRLQHRAIDLAVLQLPMELLFPTLANISSKPALCTSELRFYDRDVECNEEQRQAVKRIVSGCSRPAPYLIFGPPGTGKTKTTVEAIKQVLKNIPGSRILACAPSNSATDLLCDRLLKHVPKTEVLRLNAFYRPKSQDISDAVMSVSCYDYDTGSFEMPELDQLKRYRVVISTLITAGRLVSIPIQPGHFTHIFIDESGHAVEPECLVPVAGLLDPSDPNGGQLVLAGDPKQLGPVLRSKTAIKYGLQVSFLERLMTQCVVYQRQSKPSVPRDQAGYNLDVVTKLVQNYRSHPDILKLPNELFYDSELQARADEIMRMSLCQWEHLPQKGFPIIFEGIEGEDQREADSPSFFNPQEAIMVYKYIEKLIDTRGIRINDKEIGVISPYKKQVEKIKTMLRAKGHDSVKVGSVEEFQGQERRIIIISTVRSNPTFLTTDRDYNLGFLDNPKRFNVAITRAKALLIVIGNPKLLRKDKYWNTLLQFVRTRGGYTGVEYSDVSPADEAQGLLERMQELGLHRADAYPDPSSAGDEEAVSEITLQLDPGWRSEH